jgi:hypothetical protein
MQIGHRHLPGGEHLNAVVGNLEDRVLEVDNLALHVNGDDLTAARR